MRNSKALFATLSMILFFCISTSHAQDFNGFALYNKQNSSEGFLIDKDQKIAHSWSFSSNCNYAILLKDNGNVVRGAVNNSNSIRGAAVGGTVQEFDKDGNLVWEFDYSNSEHVSHHDITLIGDNVLLTAWEVKSAAECEQAGWSGSSVAKWPTHFVEIQQDGSGGKIVWEWHIWDHLIQEHDKDKDNYGVVADHPELIDINMISSTRGGDWFHVNGVDYNEDLDQIAFSSRHASEIYIIDHSTTTAEAATHSGGNSGKGGDILYRWGNPANYGATGDQIITAAVHDVRWIKKGRPNEGYLQVFNNEGGSSKSSVIDAIKPPVDGYNYTLVSGKAYEPTSYSWRHECLANANGQSASDRMTNGNTFVNLSKLYMYEVDSTGKVVWQYNGGGPPKAFRYECDHPGIMALLDNPCALSAKSSIETFDFVIYPNPSDGIFNIKGLENSNNLLQVYNTFGHLVLEQTNSETLDLSFFAKGIYTLRVTDDNGLQRVKNLALN